MHLTPFNSLRKLLGSARLWGGRRSLVKAMGRLRVGTISWLGVTQFGRARDVGIVGCGQFAFATIGYFVLTKSRHAFAACFDAAPHAASGFGRFYGIPAPSPDAAAVINASGVNLVYIASNHHSHTPYTLQALAAGKNVFVEKPICVSQQQYTELKEALSRSRSRIYVGYNRPFSRAVRLLKQRCEGATGPLTMTATVACHKLAADHWYRDANEGTRICGNAGHWLDLLVHVASWGQLARTWSIQLSWSSENERDDNLAIVLTSEAGDLFSLVMTSRSEPFDGIEESIFIQRGEVLAKIDDFRAMTVRIGPSSKTYRFWPKDVGHEASILQPFDGQQRDLKEIVRSTGLMLHIADMAQKGVKSGSYTFDTPNN